MENQEILNQQRQLIYLLCYTFEKKVTDYQIGVSHRTAAANQIDQTYITAQKVLVGFSGDERTELEDKINGDYDSALKKLHKSTVKGNEFTEAFWKRVHC